ncbi:lipoprotein-releasing ABC transporter permease subunit [Methylovirgula sp. 4M-Z18]|uniref:lipoprotein-releasing ABC transporter permease subunit n=1 Tax=Methylovirgula sp. 4M-Z18 TaxID=2293567 RepID=UPI000E2F8672|nr:lipoprotein-releasing ABC transporter permease subunit [Methylovirgula sp. 4M-Z18]RFB80949.1 lipoprotein-releasing ABC transporter permease subunit [Methylovirgula sp. 4M-Z18]
MAKVKISPTPFEGAKPFSLMEWMVALRYMRSRRHPWLPSALAGFSILGIAIGVMALIAVMAAMNGFQQELLHKLIGVNGHFFVQAAEPPFKNYDEVVKRIAAVPGVRQALPLIEEPSGISSSYGAQSGALVRGIREEGIKRLPGIEGNVIAGSLDDFDKDDSIALGKGMADKMGVGIDDTVSLLVAKGAQTPFGVTPRLKPFKVKAIFEIGMQDLDGLIVYVPLAQAQAFFNKDNDITLIEAFVDDPSQVDQIRPQIEQAVGVPAFITDWRQRFKSLTDSLGMIRAVAFFVVSMVSVVAALLIVMGLIMLVKDKTHDIAIMRTMGSTRGAMMRIFLLIGIANGVLGSVLGVILGLGLTHNFESIRAFVVHITGIDIFPSNLFLINQLPLVVDPREVMLTVVMTLCLSLLATLYPSRRAAGLDPVEALRYE